MSFAFYQSLLGGDFGVYQTVSVMMTLANASLRDPQALIRRRAESVISGVPEKDDQAEISSLFSFVENSLHYVDDPVDVEMVKTPQRIDEEITRTGFFMGDCDDASVYLASLLKSIGYQVQFVIVTPQGSQDYDYHHIYVRVWLSRSQTWLALDATAKAYPMGWEVPNVKEKVYDV